jgi:hypothetical protein
MNFRRREFLKQMVSLGFTVATAEALFALTACSTLKPTRKPAGNGKSLNDSIAIVGAGASGIASAHFLALRGYQNVTIFEASDHIGGKCNTAQINGKDYDMGAVFTTSSYDEVRALANHYNVPIVPLQGQHTSKNIISTKTGKGRSRTESETTKLGLASVDYFRALSEYPHLIKSGFTELSPDLCAPLSEWIEKHSFLPHSLNEFFGFTFTPFGYGFVEEVPAAYALKYYEQRLVSSLLTGNNLCMVRDGYQNLWKTVARDMDVRLSTPVIKVHREKNERVLVETTRSSSYFDHLILTCLPEESLQFLDATSDEQSDFSKSNQYFYYSLAVEIPQSLGSSGFLPDNYSKNRTPHPLCWFKRWDDANIAIFYALSKEPLSEDAVVRTLMEDSNQYGWDLGKVHVVKKWKYFPHFQSQDLSNGIYDRLENRQGQLNTYLAGEIMNFSTVELVTRYAKDLVLRFF